MCQRHTHLEPGRGSVISPEASLGAQQGPFLDLRAQHNQGHPLNYQACLGFLIWGAVGRRWDVTGSMHHRHSSFWKEAGIKQTFFSFDAYPSKRGQTF